MKLLYIVLRHRTSSDVCVVGDKSKQCGLDFNRGAFFDWRNSQTIRLLSAILFGLFPALAWAGAENLEIVSPARSIHLSLEDLKSKLKTETIEIEDPVYKKRMTYDAFPLTAVFDIAGLKSGEAADEVVFTAKDGYSPSISFEALKKFTGYLVYQEHGKECFSLVEQGKAKVSPAPFYVVWKEGVRTEKEGLPWPYQLVKIEAVRFAKKFPKIYPEESHRESREHEGFLVFKSQCMRCHSINLEGGDMGPELNVPKNVTEYWRSDVLQKFIKNASSFRYRSKMPDFSNLSDREIENLIIYFHYMARHKTFQMER
jgi:cytochrome c2